MKKIKAFLLTKSVGLYINFLSYVAPSKAFQLAYVFFSNPRSGKLQFENLPEILQKSNQETHNLNEHHIQTYHWQGNETVILLMHGWESNSARWEKLLPLLLKTGNTIIAVDSPAHGLSSGKEFNVPLYASFAELVIQKYQPKHIIGHSMGGITAIYHQHYYSNPGLEKMVLLGAPSDFSIILHNYLNLLSLNKRIKKAFYEYTKERFQINIDEFSGKDFLKTSKTKGIIFHDTEDTVVLFEEAKKLASTWKSATLISTSGLGHSLHDDAVNQKIVAFLLEA
jgi:pimeloyl-ACP methyl ester carboxylesterase